MYVVMNVRKGDENEEQHQQQPAIIINHQNSASNDFENEKTINT